MKPDDALTTAKRVLLRCVDGAGEALTVEQATAIKVALFDAYSTIARLRAQIAHARKREDSALQREQQLIEQVLSEERRALAAERNGKR